MVGRVVGGLFFPFEAAFAGSRSVAVGTRGRACVFVVGSGRRVFGGAGKESVSGAEGNRRIFGGEGKDYSVFEKEENIRLFDGMEMASTSGGESDCERNYLVGVGAFVSRIVVDSGEGWNCGGDRFDGFVDGAEETVSARVSGIGTLISPLLYRCIGTQLLRKGSRS